MISNSEGPDKRIYAHEAAQCTTSSMQLIGHSVQVTRNNHCIANCLTSQEARARRRQRMQATGAHCDKMTADQQYQQRCHLFRQAMKQRQLRQQQQQASKQHLSLLSTHVILIIVCLVLYYSSASSCLGYELARSSSFKRHQSVVSDSFRLSKRTVASVSNEDNKSMSAQNPLTRVYHSDYDKLLAKFDYNSTRKSDLISLFKVVNDTRGVNDTIWRGIYKLVDEAAIPSTSSRIHQATNASSESSTFESPPLPPPPPPPPVKQTVAPSTSTAMVKIDRANGSSTTAGASVSGGRYREIVFENTIFLKGAFKGIEGNMSKSYEGESKNDAAIHWTILYNATTILVIKGANKYYYWTYGQTAGSLIIFCMIVVGNLSILYRLKSHRRRRSNVNYFIMQLAIADLLVGAFSITLDSWLRIQRAFTWGLFACRASKYISCLFIYSSTNLLVALSVDRWEAVVKPLAFTRNRSRGHHLVAGSWLLALIFALPMIFKTKIKEIDGLPQCWIDLDARGWRIYLIYLTSLLLILPTLIIAICYIHIVYTIWSKAKLVNDQQLRRHRQQQQHQPQQQQSTSSAVERIVESRMSSGTSRTTNKDNDTILISLIKQSGDGGAGSKRSCLKSGSKRNQDGQHNFRLKQDDSKPMVGPSIQQQVKFSSHDGGNDDDDDGDDDSNDNVNDSAALASRVDVDLFQKIIGDQRWHAKLSSRNNNNNNNNKETHFSADKVRNNYQSVAELLMIEGDDLNVKRSGVGAGVDFLMNNDGEADDDDDDDDHEDDDKFHASKSKFAPSAAFSKLDRSSSSSNNNNNNNDKNNNNNDYTDLNVQPQVVSALLRPSASPANVTPISRSSPRSSLSSTSSSSNHSSSSSSSSSPTSSSSASSSSSSSSASASSSRSSSTSSLTAHSQTSPSPAPPLSCTNDEAVAQSVSAGRETNGFDLGRKSSRGRARSRRRRRRRRSTSDSSSRKALVLMPDAVNASERTGFSIQTADNIGNDSSMVSDDNNNNNSNSNSNSSRTRTRRRSSERIVIKIDSDERWPSKMDNYDHKEGVQLIIGDAGSDCSRQSLSENLGASATVASGATGSNERRTTERDIGGDGGSNGGVRFITGGCCSNHQRRASGLGLVNSNRQAPDTRSDAVQSSSMIICDRKGNASEKNREQHCGQQKEEKQRLAKPELQPQQQPASSIGRDQGFVAQQHGSGVIPKARIKTIKMTLVIVVAYILCWSPFLLLNLGGHFGLIKNDTNVSLALFTLTQSLAHLNSAVNPIIFWLFSSKRTNSNNNNNNKNNNNNNNRSGGGGGGQRQAATSASAAGVALAGTGATNQNGHNGGDQKIKSFQSVVSNKGGVVGVWTTMLTNCTRFKWRTR